MQTWKDHANHIDASKLEADLELSADVVIVGSGAGGGVAAEILSKAGVEVLIVEAGQFFTKEDFTLTEAQAYRDLYFDVGARKTKNADITMLQGRSVGGTTVVNWTTCFETPQQTLNHWADHFETAGFSDAEMAPWFEQMAARLNIHRWQIPPNTNNAALARGCEALGWHHGIMSRNVKGCLNSGYCGMGCPVDAKMSMLVTTIPGALENGAKLLSLTHADALTLKGDRVTGLKAHAVAGPNQKPTGKQIRITARKQMILAGGAINNPGLMLRSGLPDPHATLGKRTTLHPVVATFAAMPEPVGGWSGAPQSVYSDEFLWRESPDGPVGYKLEVSPLYPAITANLLPQYGAEHAKLASQHAHLQTNIALLRDGFSADSVGGHIELRDDGYPVLDYPLTDAIWEGAKHAMLAMAEVQFAAGAKEVIPAHYDRPRYQSWAQAKQHINNEMIFAPHHCGVYSAHIMGGCAIGDDETRTVVNSQGRHHQLDGLSVMDGSLFPTSLGVNPSFTIYGMVAKLATQLSAELGS